MRWRVHRDTEVVRDRDARAVRKLVACAFGGCDKRWQQSNLDRDIARHQDVPQGRDEPHFTDETGSGGLHATLHVPHRDRPDFTSLFERGRDQIRVKWQQRESVGRGSLGEDDDRMSLLEPIAHALVHRSHGMAAAAFYVKRSNQRHEQPDQGPASDLGFRDETRRQRREQREHVNP